jgi:LacI family transcriptional regulator
MKDFESLAHVRWECKYHVIFIPKYRRKIIYGKLRAAIGEILRDLCKQKGIGLLDRLMSGRKVRPDCKPILIPPRGVVTRRSTDITVTPDTVVADALRFIRDHAFKPITVDDVVQELSVSRAMLYRRFQKAIGRSPHEHILRIRLERVRQLLMQTSLPVWRIAAVTGFEHTEYLVAAFRREVGMTPGQYRAECHR